MHGGQAVERKEERGKRMVPLLATEGKRRGLLAEEAI